MKGGEVSMIKDVQVIPLEVHEDDRGYFIEIARHADDSEPRGAVHQFGQLYLVSEPVRRTIRAFHKHNELWDWFFISHDREQGYRRELCGIDATSGV